MSERRGITRDGARSCAVGGGSRLVVGMVQCGRACRRSGAPGWLGCQLRRWGHWRTPSLVCPLRPPRGQLRRPLHVVRRRPRGLHRLRLRLGGEGARLVPAPVHVWTLHIVLAAAVTSLLGLLSAAGPSPQRSQAAPATADPLPACPRPLQGEAAVGSYADAGGRCRDCPAAGCMACEGASGACTRCAAGKGLIDGRCVDCGDSRCLACDGDVAKCTE